MCWWCVSPSVLSVCLSVSAFCEMVSYAGECGLLFQIWHHCQQTRQFVTDKTAIDRGGHAVTLRPPDSRGQSMAMMHFTCGLLWGEPNVRCTNHLRTCQHCPHYLSHLRTTPPPPLTHQQVIPCIVC